MKDLKILLKSNKIVKNYRVKKWKKYAGRMMFSPAEIIELEKHLEKIREALYLHIKSNPDVPNDITEELEQVLQKSYLAGTERIEDELKTDMLFWFFAYGFSFNEYLCYRFIEKSKETSYEKSSMN